MKIFCTDTPKLLLTFAMYMSVVKLGFSWSALPAYRGRGIGSQLIKAVQQKGAEMGKTVTIHVEYNNPALQLYQRLGFQKIGEFNSVYYLLEWKPVA